MNEELKQFTADLAKELQTKLEAPEIKEFVATVKASGDDRTFDVVMSTADEDRQGDSLDQSRWDLKYYVMNPVVLWAHDYSSFPIGIITDIEVQGDKAVVTGKFAPAGVNPAADMACALYQEKILRAVSPGYIQNDDGTRELLEVSFCPVPAGRYALSLRQVERLGVSTRDLVTKGFFFDAAKKAEGKSPQAGDGCETDDGTPGVLAEDDDNPGEMICVPREQKENKSNENQGAMNDELIKAIETEHGRHGEAVGKAIDDFSEKGLNDDGSTKEDTTKAIDEFEKAIEGENADHLEKCMKAIDDNSELQDQKKSIDEFKSAMQDEHMKHVKCFDKSIDEFKDAWADGDHSDRVKAIDDFTKSAGEELARHKDAQMEACKAEVGEEKAAKAVEQKGAVADTLEQGAEYRTKNARMDYVQTVLYAFCNAYYNSPLESFRELIAEAIEIIQAYVADEASEDAQIDEKTVKGIVAESIKAVSKSGRAISAATGEKIKAIMKALEDHNTEHATSTTTAIASLKELLGSPQDDEGKEKQAKPLTAPKPKVESLKIRATESEAPLSEFENFMFTRGILKAVYQASGLGLTRIAKELKEKFPDRR